MAYVRASGFNAFVPAATGQVISYIRDPAKYKLNQYVQLVKSDLPVGVYYRVQPDDTARAVATTDNVWADGNTRKKANVNGVRFDTDEFQCVRRNEGTTIGWQALETGNKNGLKLLVANTALVRNVLMIKRTMRVLSLLETAGNWGANVASATTLGGGFWDSGTIANPVVKSGLLNAALAIHLATNGLVADMDNEEDLGLQLILSPDAAVRMAKSEEIHDYLARSPFALGQIVGGKRGQNALWGLPDQLYGFKLVVENAVKVTELPAAAGTLATTNRGWAKGLNSAVITSRPGGLDGQMGAPSFSTMQIFYHEQEMSLETYDDAEDKLTRAHCSENVAEELAAPLAGYLITNLFT